ncbi:hypothetical protein AGABI1DRAFT_107363 [Agaricus bisporus var. burnettii JB137-S8]|uniref:Uncharacterized protein n=1 Tax=Agaricus bisporus var. burnettii (strain JB137-S8 / ATCC MYA-4627 / FGSC 10392) TaxID=597362 RepID=K5VWS3_AGABU|nr:uncharacterized protein AGABI1DRAFT_107363 [Agaricus bisporus var. burnettii JB137-S8]EKM78924.1 hypothetical protein AGABI1DRAFT_107363 [Agaricus bisporus var. burnettii JB137-S8]
MSTLEYPSHHNSATKTEVDPQVRATNEEPLALLHDVCHEGDHTILAEDSVVALRQFNDAQAKTRNLPIEILSMIFELACPPNDINDRYGVWHPGFDTFRAEDTFHFILASVCYYWRAVVLSTPQLWTAITLRPNRPGLSIQNTISLLNLYFERAQPLPISIELDFQGGGIAELLADRDEPIEVSKGYLARLEPLKAAVLVKGASMIQHLTLIQAPTQWFRYVNGNLSRCTSVGVFDLMRLIEINDGGDNEEKKEDGESDKETNGENGEDAGSNEVTVKDDKDDFPGLDFSKLPRLERLDVAAAAIALHDFPFKLPNKGTITLRVKYKSRIIDELLRRYEIVFDTLIDSLKELMERIAPGALDRLNHS